MRRLGYGLLALIGLVALLAVATAVWRQWEGWRNLAPARNAGLDERVLFEAAPDRPLAFNTSTHQGWFALQGFVVATRDARLRGLPLTVEITLHRADGSAVDRWSRYLLLPAVQHVRAYGLLDGRSEQAVWILPSEWIDLTRRPDVRSVSVRTVDAGEGVQSVLWRGAIDQRLSDAQARLRWRRLGDDARERLLSDWITPPGLVDPSTKYDLVRHRRQRIGPLGQPGEDFVARRVLRRVEQTAPRRYAPRYNALAIAPAMPVGVELEQPLEVVIDARAPTGAPLPVAVWRRGAATPLAVPDGHWQGTWPAGVYELRTAAAGSVEVREAASGDSLIPMGLRPRTHRASSTRTLRYRLFPLGDAPPPVRLRVRAEQPGDTAQAQLRFVDSAGRPLAVRDIAVPWRASRHDREGANPDRAAAVPVQVDLQPPAAARGIELASDRPVLASMFTTVARADRTARPGPARRWYSFLPELDARSRLYQGVVLIEQPRLGQTKAVTARGGRGITRRATIEGSRDRDVTPQRPRLRLRPERSDDTERSDDAD
ncbi:hypothetical protein [Cognatilysobacter bugurensis]|uniref:Uncharacterized protein n=1 Tax=Cognatilysobacter bugurensis TaxID=543356 RepID=A0A918W8A1_9GAMM|nr:hypothetical protein [Lysobacter bugurensis]GHA80176.1 hypothetical protein GCM10007067_17330 [Lysobacter bugurensis]